jgi:hypothetical protein
MPVPRLDHLLANENQESRHDLEDLLRRTASLLSIPGNSSKPSPQAAAAVSIPERLSAKAG